MLLGFAVVVPLLFVGLVAMLHTLTVAITYGGPFMLRLFFPTVAVVLAISIITQRNAIHSLLSLMGVFLVTAGIYFSINASYFALVFILIGQGAVAILFLYAVILLPLRALQNAIKYYKDRKQVTEVTTGILGLFGLTFLLSFAFAVFFEHNQGLLARIESTSVEAFRYFVGLSLNDVLAFVDLYTKGSSLFMLVTLILLSAMLGAIILATTSGNSSSKIAKALSSNSTRKHRVTSL